MEIRRPLLLKETPKSFDAMIKRCLFIAGGHINRAEFRRTALEKHNCKIWLRVFVQPESQKTLQCNNRAATSTILESVFNSLRDIFFSICYTNYTSSELAPSASSPMDSALLRRRWKEHATNPLARCHSRSLEEDWRYKPTSLLVSLS